MSHVIRNARALLAGAFLLSLLAAGEGNALQRTLVIEDFQARIQVRSNGELLVTERITVQFRGAWNGIFRTVPVEYRTPQLFNYTLRLRVASVTDGAGRVLRYEVERDRHHRRIRIWVPGAEDATHTVQIQYVAANGLRFFEEHDELYWNVTGHAWEHPIQRAGAEVILPVAAQNIRATAFAGAAGAVEQGAEIEHIANSVYFRGLRALGLHEGMTIVVGWDPGAVQRPTAGMRAVGFLRSNMLFGVPLFAFCTMFALWHRFGRDPALNPIFVRYEPPEGLTPAEAGTLLDDSPDMRDITATMIDLAVRGFLLIEESEDEQFFGLVRTRDYQFTLLRAGEWSQLKLHERALLEGLRAHARSDRVQLSDLENAFYKQLPAIRTQLTRSLVTDGYYHRRPDRVRQTFLGIAAAVTVGGLVAAQFVTARFGLSPFTTTVAMLLTGAVIGGFGMVMPARTGRGNRMLESVLGFEEFLGRVDEDRLRRMDQDPANFERYLPYAMAFGVEKNWARAFEGMYRTPPDWYRGSSIHFRPQLFVADLGRMTGAASTAMASAPRSSSGGSGFGGGGSSGGGFGGGGGGGF